MITNNIKKKRSKVVLNQTEREKNEESNYKSTRQQNWKIECKYAHINHIFLTWKTDKKNTPHV